MIEIVKMSLVYLLNAFNVCLYKAVYLNGPVLMISPTLTLHRFVHLVSQDIVLDQEFNCLVRMLEVAIVDKLCKGYSHDDLIKLEPAKSPVCIVHHVNKFHISSYKETVDYTHWKLLVNQSPLSFHIKELINPTSRHTPPKCIH